MVSHRSTPETRENLITQARVALWAAPLWGDCSRHHNRFYPIGLWSNYSRGEKFEAYTTAAAVLSINGSQVQVGITKNRHLVTFTPGIYTWGDGFYDDYVGLEELSNESLKVLISAFSVKQRPERGMNRHRHGRRRRYRVQN